MSLKILEQVAPAPPPMAAPLMVAQGSFRRQDFGTTVWVHALANGILFPKVLEPIYWSPIAREVRPGDRMEVLPEDGTFFAELLVRSTTEKTVRVHVLRHIELPDDSVPNSEIPFSALYRGPVKRYCLTQAGKIVREGFESAEAALKAIPTLDADERK